MLPFLPPGFRLCCTSQTSQARVPWHVQLPELSSVEESPARLRWFNGEGTENRNLRDFPAPDKRSKEKPALWEVTTQVQQLTWFCRVGVGLSYI